MAETKAETKSAKTPTLPEGWTLVSEQEGFFTAERYVESLGLQKVTESGVDMAALAAACEAYDAHQQGVADGLEAQQQPAPQTAEST